jgi:hypothetical protein
MEDSRLTKNRHFGRGSNFGGSRLVFLATLLFIPRMAAGAEIADRVVVSVNNIPYTQSQIERYLNVKECLRDDPGSAQTVGAANWKEAVASFVRDFSIHQEASKSSGFRPSRESVDRLGQRCGKNLEKSQTLQNTFARLKLAKSSLESELLRVATIENFRRSRATLSQSKQGNGTTWEKEIDDRTVVRYFERALEWVPLEPTK